ncbi:MAG: zinc ABC transporter substrate-binding protein, partial [Armatimonadota bacterium]|nr:zinc ABC transporter substrate-binding protein [Armatimonadota bacterium]
IWGISTEDEPSAQEIARLVDSIRRERVPAVFVETTINPKLMERVARDAGVRVGRSLYGDSLGPPGSNADTYVKMMRHNVAAIVEALR